MKPKLSKDQEHGPKTSTTWLKYIARVAWLLALVVVSLGAYTRLTHAGLGCPDWPGCYGHLVLPSSSIEQAQAQSLYPHQTIEPLKAWTEMIHRYAAGGLVLLILMSLIISWQIQKKGLTSAAYGLKFPLFLTGWITFQAALGMWTVTWQLLPAVVMAHLLSGAILFCALSLYLYQLEEGASPKLPRLPRFRVGLNVALMCVLIQMALGGWVSANYAGIACVGFPSCNGYWWPFDWSSFKIAIQILHAPIGVNYQGGVLHHAVRMLIQMIHRWGALVITLYLLGFMVCLWRKVNHRAWRRGVLILLFLLVTQLTLGLMNVVYYLPLGVAVAHNVVAVLLLTTLGVMRYACRT
jgi:cytochrome c oxidase assembly protein subunit 15